MSAVISSQTIPVTVNYGVPRTKLLNMLSANVKPPAIVLSETYAVNL